jgi:BRCT domain type II-containing protein
VFTGELSSFSRHEAIDLAKRFGGCAHRAFLFPLDVHL